MSLMCIAPSTYEVQSHWSTTSLAEFRRPWNRGPAILQRGNESNCDAAGGSLCRLARSHVTRQRHCFIACCSTQKVSGIGLFLLSVSGQPGHDRPQEPDQVIDPLRFIHPVSAVGVFVPLDAKSQRLQPALKMLAIPHRDHLVVSTMLQEDRDRTQPFSC